MATNRDLDTLIKLIKDPKGKNSDRIFELLKQDDAYLNQALTAAVEAKHINATIILVGYGAKPTATHKKLSTNPIISGILEDPDRAKRAYEKMLKENILSTKQSKTSPVMVKSNPTNTNTTNETTPNVPPKDGSDQKRKRTEHHRSHSQYHKDMNLLKGVKEWLADRADPVALAKKIGDLVGPKGKILRQYEQEKKKKQAGAASSRATEEHHRKRHTHPPKR